jgi:hypothetical protein
VKFYGNLFIKYHKMANLERKYLVVSSKDLDSERRAFVSEILKEVDPDNVTFVSHRDPPSMKSFCGHDRVYTRSMYAEPATFVPTHPFKCMADGPPKPSENDAAWRRIREIAYAKLSESKGSTTQITGRMSR